MVIKRFYGVISLLYMFGGMQAADLSVQELEGFAPVKITLKKSSEADVDSGKVPPEGYDFVEQYAQDPVTLTSFKEMLDTNYLAKLPTIIARVAVTFEKTIKEKDKPDRKETATLYTYWTMLSANEHIFGSTGYFTYPEIFFHSAPEKWSRYGGKYHPAHNEDLQRRRIAGKINYYVAYGDSNSVNGFYFLGDDQELTDNTGNRGDILRTVYGSLYALNLLLDQYSNIVSQEAMIPARLARMPQEIKELTDKIAKLKIELPKKLQETGLNPELLRRVKEMRDKREALNQQLRDFETRNPTATPEERKVRDEYYRIGDELYQAERELGPATRDAEYWEKQLADAQQELKDLNDTEKKLRVDEKELGAKKLEAYRDVLMLSVTQFPQLLGLVIKDTSAEEAKKLEALSQEIAAIKSAGRAAIQLPTAQRAAPRGTPQLPVLQGKPQLRPVQQRPTGPAGSTQQPQWLREQEERKRASSQAPSGVPVRPPMMTAGQTPQTPPPGVPQPPRIQPGGVTLRPTQPRPSTTEAPQVQETEWQRKLAARRQEEEEKRRLAQTLQTPPPGASQPARVQPTGTTLHPTQPRPAQTTAGTSGAQTELERRLAARRQEEKTQAESQNVTTKIMQDIITILRRNIQKTQNGSTVKKTWNDWPEGGDWDALGNLRGDAGENTMLGKFLTVFLDVFEADSIAERNSLLTQMNTIAPLLFGTTPLTAVQKGQIKKALGEQFKNRAREVEVIVQSRVGA